MCLELVLWENGVVLTFWFLRHSLPSTLGEFFLEGIGASFGSRSGIRVLCFFFIFPLYSVVFLGFLAFFFLFMAMFIFFVLFFGLQQEEDDVHPSQQRCNLSLLQHR